MDVVVPLDPQGGSRPLEQSRDSPHVVGQHPGLAVPPVEQVADDDEVEPIRPTAEELREATGAIGGIGTEMHVGDEERRHP